MEKLQEACDELFYKDVFGKEYIDFEADGVYPFKYNHKSFDIIIGDEKGMHNYMIPPDNGILYDSHGRIYTEQKVLGFWNYPDYDRLNEFLEKLKTQMKEQKDLNVDFSKNWKIEIDMGEGSAENFMDEYGYELSDFIASDRNERGYKEYLMQLNKFRGWKDATPEMKKMHLLKADEKEKLRKQGKLNIPDNSGSKKRPDDIRHAQTMAQYKARTSNENKLLNFNDFIKQSL